MVNVPSQYSPLISEMSSATGIPQDVIAAQANNESAFSATARSSAGALGWLQFLPSTYSSYAAQAGVPGNSEFNPADEAKVYDVYMSSLLKQEKGNLRNALAAYNAGPGNISAGLGYADKILGEAGQGGGSNISTGNPQTTSSLIPGISISGVLGNVFGDMRDILERSGLILLGAALILLGIHLLSGGGSQPVNIQTSTEEGPGGKTTTKQVKHPLGKSTTKSVEGVGTKQAVEAAAVA